MERRDEEEGGKERREEEKEGVGRGERKRRKGGYASPGRIPSVHTT